MAVYAAADGPLSWSEFFGANFERAAYIHEHFLADVQFTSVMGVAVFAGIASCLFTALINAPLYHAIAGPNYPLAPRRWAEVANLFVFYLLYNAILGVVPLLVPVGGIWEIVVQALAWIVILLVVFADFVIVYERVSVVPAVRRSVQLLRLSWAPVLGLLIVYNFVFLGLQLLYHHFYDGQDTVFVILPIAQILLDSIVLLFANLVLIFLYEDLRRRSPAG